jgi:hypothetical protein
VVETNLLIGRETLDMSPGSYYSREVVAGSYKLKRLYMGLMPADGENSKTTDSYQVIAQKNLCSSKFIRG